MKAAVSVQILIFHIFSICVFHYDLNIFNVKQHFHIIQLNKTNEIRLEISSSFSKMRDQNFKVVVQNPTTAFYTDKLSLFN